MPIIEITESQLVQRCEACSKTRGLGLDDLHPTDEGGTVLAIPACPCGAVEFIMGAPDDEPEHPAPGSFGHRHRLVVNALVDTVRRRAKGEAGGPLDTAVTQHIGRSDLSKWFPDGVRLEPVDPDQDARERTPKKDLR